MDEQKIIIESLVMDLKRVALGLHRGSFQMANRFKEEALKRTEELESQEQDPYLSTLIEKSKETLKSEKERVAEDALMYSTLLQNFVQKRI